MGPLGSLEDNKGKLDFSGNEKEALCRHKVWGHGGGGGSGEQSDIRCRKDCATFTRQLNLPVLLPVLTGMSPRPPL